MVLCLGAGLVSVLWFEGLKVVLARGERREATCDQGETR
jgi:hypothetical protein